MRLHEVASDLGLTVLPTPWVEHWEAFEARRDPADVTALMSSATIDELSRSLRMPADACEALKAHLSLFDQRPALRPLFQLCHHLLYRAGEHAGVSAWPTFREEVVPGGNMFYAYLFLAGRDYLHQQHGKRGIPPIVSDETLSDLFIWMDAYRQKHGCWGLDALGWVANYVLKNSLIQLGRLQYVFNTFRLPFRGYRHTRTGRVAVLAREGRKFRSDGQFDGENRRLEREGPWTSTLEVNEREVRGHLVHPDGYVLRQPRTLPVAEWEVVFDEGSPALSVHIPACGPLSSDACRASLREALSFFPRHFPERPFDLVWCYSWLMDAQWKAYLPDTSNIVRFMNEFYLLPFPNTSGWQTFERTFGSANVDLSKVEPRTSVQYAVLEHVRRGGAWRCPGGVIFPDRYEPGANAYRASDWEPRT